MMLYIENVIVLLSARMVSLLNNYFIRGVFSSKLSANEYFRSQIK